ncbi:MAG TPA: hypothetical protein VLC06_21160 [Polyangia bacterium]|nr:hypothetical protein [Polyangia bacterium]
MTFWVIDWLRAFGLTLVVELPIAAALLSAVEPRLGRRLAVIALANLATHPLVWFLFPGLALGHGARLALSETWAFLVELAIYLLVWPALRLRRAALTSLAANGASFAVGLACARLWVAP